MVTIYRNKQYTVLYLPKSVYLICSLYHKIQWIVKTHVCSYINLFTLEEFSSNIQMTHLYTTYSPRSCFTWYLSITNIVLCGELRRKTSRQTSLFRILYNCHVSAFHCISFYFCPISFSQIAIICMFYKLSFQLV